MTFRFVRLFLLLMLVMPQSGCAVFAPNEQPGGGQWLQATGTAYANEQEPRGRIRKNAVALAEKEARAKIREKFKTIEAKPGVSIMEAMQNSAYVWSRIMGVLNATHASQETVGKDGRIDVILRVNLSQIRDIAVYGEEAETVEKFAKAQSGH